MRIFGGKEGESCNVRKAKGEYFICQQSAVS